MRLNIQANASTRGSYESTKGPERGERDDFL